MKKRPWLKWGGIVLCAAIVVVIVMMFAYVRRVNEAERKELREISKEYEEIMRPLWNEKARLEQEITEQERMAAEEAPPSPVILLCTEPNKRILDDVCPIADQYGYPSGIVISEDAFPGDEDCLTMGDVVHLLDQGWDLCIGIDADTDLAALCQRVADAGLPTPTAVYYPSGDVTGEQEEQIQALGIHAVICYGVKLTKRNTEGLWHSMAYGSNESNAKSVFQGMVHNAMPLVLTVGYSSSREQFSAENYSNMLKTVSSYERTGDLEVLSIRDASEAYLRSQNGAFSELETDMQRHLRELKEELDAVNARIWDIERDERSKHDDK